MGMWMETAQRPLDHTGHTRQLMREIGLDARGAARELALAPVSVRNAALTAAAAALRRRREEILRANAVDLVEARSPAATAAFIDRLTLDASRIEAMAEGVAAVAALPDPVGRVLAVFERPNGL